MPGASVELRHVTKRYETQERAAAAAGAVNDLNLAVAPGEICVLVGPSGCGKTTTLKMVNRLIEPSSGQILIDGVDVQSVEATALRRRIGYVIQQIGLFPHRTIAENVATVPKLLGWSRERTRARVDELLALVGLDPGHVRTRYPAQLSGGERQRVGVARALAVEPPVMLMDEPFGAVDPIVRERLQDEFLRLHERLGTTILFVTHDIDEAIRMGTRVAVMREGGLLAQCAPPTELLMHPANEFVARFVGADRGLKRLALTKLEAVEPSATTVARVGETATVARARAAVAHEPWALLLDRDEHPLGWLDVDALVGDAALGADAAAPRPALTFTAETSVRDALSALLSDPVQTGVVVDRGGAYRGVIILANVAALLRDAAAPPVAPSLAAVGTSG